MMIKKMQRMLLLLLLVMAGCTTVDNAITPPEPAKQGFFSDEINRLIDENYPRVMADGYAELRIPGSMYDQGIYPIAAEHKRALDAISAAGYLAYVNGGAVRDGILGTAIHDVDFSTNATPEQMTAVAIEGAEVKVVTTGGGEIAKAYHTSGEVTDMVPIHGIDEHLKGKPFVPADATVGKYSKSLLDDTYSRDLTINSLYYDYKAGDIIDYHGGLHDLREKVIRTVYDPNVMYPINPSTLIRTVRFAARYGFGIDDTIAKAITDNMHCCDNLRRGMNCYYVMKGFTDGCGKRTYQYYVKYGIIGHFALMLKGYVGNKDYEDYLFAALDYLDEKKNRFFVLGITTLFLPCLEDNLGTQEPTLENITAVWDKLETESGQKKIFEVGDYHGARAETLTTWYLYKQMTTEATLDDVEKVEAIKGNVNYPKALLLLGACAKSDSSLQRYTGFWK